MPKKQHPQTQQSLLSGGNTHDFLANLATLMADNTVDRFVTGAIGRTSFS